MSPFGARADLCPKGIVGISWMQPLKGLPRIPFSFYLASLGGRRVGCCNSKVTDGSMFTQGVLIHASTSLFCSHALVQHLLCACFHSDASLWGGVQEGLGVRKFCNAALHWTVWHADSGLCASYLFACCVLAPTPLAWSPNFFVSVPFFASVFAPLAWLPISLSP